MDHIFISIAAYRDPELVPTIADCLARATHPDRLRFGVCWQHGPDEAGLPWTGDPRFRILDVDWRASRGVCWARAELMRLHDGEDYFLQLDSHHRFADGWDVRMIDQMRLADSAKPVLTTYGTPYDPNAPLDRSSVPMQMDFDTFTSDGIPVFRPAPLEGWPSRDRPARARFVSAHFLFAAGAFAQEVPYDPSIYFVGEEITLAVRAFTHGYDLFHPAEALVWHEYTREYRPHKHWTDHTGENGVAIAWHRREQVSVAAVHAVLGGARVGPLGLGSARTLAEYERYAGLNFLGRTADECTRRHEEPPEPARAR